MEHGLYILPFTPLFDKRFEDFSRNDQNCYPVSLLKYHR
jgi:hypothetical protein